jgi:hypothetical protein
METTMFQSPSALCRAAGCLLALATLGCSDGNTPDDDLVEPERNILYNEDGNGELNVIGCEFSGTSPGAAYAVPTQVWMYGDLAQLKNVGDKITETSVLHQLTGPDIPEQLGLHRLDGWTFAFESDDAGEDVLLIEGPGVPVNGERAAVSMTVPFYEGTYQAPVKMTAGEETASIQMTCEVSFWRR